MAVVKVFELVKGSQRFVEKFQVDDPIKGELMNLRVFGSCQSLIIDLAHSCYVPSEGENVNLVNKLRAKRRILFNS